MASANPITDAFGYTPAVSPSSKTSTNGLGKDTFMKLLVAQMSQQNPMEPTDDKEMISQMTQFSMLEQITNLATANAEAATAGKMAQAVGMIGKTASYLDSDGVKQTGTVDQVNLVNGVPQLTIGGNEGILASQLTQVR